MVLAGGMRAAHMREGFFASLRGEPSESNPLPPVALRLRKPQNTKGGTLSKAGAFHLIQNWIESVKNPISRVQMFKSADCGLHFSATTAFQRHNWHSVS
ncbi:MAG: hypothetical protein DMG68_17780 [Acidobacteria bacterium]|nr:MAG: hypothetical protein DMG68_17780 [Acidobacteriota bacterium]